MKSAEQWLQDGHAIPGADTTRAQRDEIRLQFIRQIQADAIRSTINWIQMDPRYDGRNIFEFTEMKLKELEPN